MKKKEYMTPMVEVMEVKTDQLLVLSGVNSDFGIDYGDVDTDGTLDPASRELLGID